MNFNRASHFEHEERYERAREFAEVVKGLWDSWDDDAFLRDTESGIFFRADGLHALNHNGKHFSVKGPLNVSRPPQGHPIIVQAGASEAGISLAAEIAEAIFCTPNNLTDAKSYYADIKGRLSQHGRSPDDIKVLPGLSPCIAESRDEAEAKYDHLQSMIHPIVAREILGTVLGHVDLSPYDLNGPLPDLGETNASQSTLEYFSKMARDENLTILQLAMRVAGARGKAVIKGSPADVADFMEEWFMEEGADGFNILPPYLPGALNDFVDLVIPELQRRNIYRIEYTGSTLRENLGLRRPESRYK